MEQAARSAHVLVALALAQHRDANEGHNNERDDEHAPASATNFSVSVDREPHGYSIDDSLTGDIRAIEERILGRLRR